ncbi:MAG: hypothetical protein P8J14_12010 [Emcibacteraceae bacterium]|nr:hypothetical protein [Emcibacteraceae bacterium]
MQINSLDLKIFADAPFKIDFSLSYRINHGFMYPAATPPNQSIQEIGSFFKIWQKKSKDGKLPAWKNFSFEEFVGWHANMRVVDTGNDLKALKKNIILGQDFERHWGKKTLSENIEEDKSIYKDMEKNIISIWSIYIIIITALVLVCLNRW